MNHRRFHLVRTTDVTGISGVGVVAEGVEFTDRTVVLRWVKAGTSRPDHVRPTTVVHDDIDSVIGLHGHNGATRVEWVDEATTPCQTCSGPSRETVGMVCQTCGADYGPKPPADTSWIQTTS